jgi:hypothetical protein
MKTHACESSAPAHHAAACAGGVLPGVLLLRPAGYTLCISCHADIVGATLSMNFE